MMPQSPIASDTSWRSIPDLMHDPVTIPQMLASRARSWPDRVALIDGELRVSYGELASRAERIGRCLVGLGAGPRTRVALLGHDCARTFELVFGIAAAGAVVLGINWRLTAQEIAFQLDDAECEFLFVGQEHFDKARAAAQQSPKLRTIVAMTGAPAEWSTLDAWLDATEPSTTLPTIQAEDLAAQLYTSGTTGKPKGVMLAHRSFFAVVAAMRAVGDPWIGWSQSDISLMAVPSFHIGGLWWAMTGFAAGATHVVMPTFVGWKAIEAIARHRVTKTFMVPSMLQLCMSEPDCARADFSSLDTIVYGGSPIPRPNLLAAMKTFGCGFAQIYGLTETGNTAVCLRPADHAREDLHEAAGRPYPGVDIKITSPEATTLPPRAIGEICIRSPANMLGYWKRADATAQTLRDGYVHTGDAGYLDEEGFVHVCDRIKDMICSAGENLYPAEIEGALCSHPGVAEAAVIGVPDDRWGEIAKAIVVLRPEFEAGPSIAAEILLAARAQLADFKVPRSVDFQASLPRTPSGKIQKHILRDPFWAGRSRRVN